MYYLTYQCPSQFGFSGTYDLTEDISLVNAGSLSVTKFDSRGEFASRHNCWSFFFVQKLGLTRPAVMPLERLKEFVLFWSFLLADGVSHDFFERSNSGCHIVDGMPEPVVNSESRAQIDLGSLQVLASLQGSESRSDLREFYRGYLASAPQLRQWVSLWMFNPSRGIVNGVHCLHDNYRVTTSFTWTILEALSGQKTKRCDSLIDCPKGCRDPEDPSIPARARVTHPVASMRHRVRNLFAPFPDCDYLVQVAMTIYRDDRNPFYHLGESRSLPTRELPSGREDLIATRSDVTLYGKDPLETHDAIILLRDAVRCLLLNHLYPQLNFYPVFERLESVSFSP